MGYVNDFAARFRHGLSSASPFTSLGAEWCPRCKMTVETASEAQHRYTTYAYKRLCKRCGRPIKFGVFHNVPLLTDVSSQQKRQVMDWVTLGGEDRRTKSDILFERKRG